MAQIILEKVEKWFEDLQVITGIDLEIGDGQLVVLVGPSGCGKTTTMRMIAGLEDVSRGRILIDGEDVTSRVPSERKLAMVFQSYALYPHMTVAANMGFGLKNLGTPAAEVRRKVEDVAKILQLDALLERRPKELSGGQRQRVAIGRAIVREPKAFLFDEPLSNLDAALRVEMRVEIGRLHGQLESSMIYVTHDQIEAMTLADKIVLMDHGRIVQSGSPRDLYERPNSLFAAQFIGSPPMNVMPAASLPGVLVPGEAKSVGVRPEHIRLTPAGQGDARGRIEVIEYLGAETHIYIGCGDVGRLTVRTDAADSAAVGDEVGLAFDPDRRHFFAQDGGALDG